MDLLKTRGSVLFMFLFMLFSIFRLAAEYFGSQRILPQAIPCLMWLFLSIGFIFTLCDMIEMYAYKVISECLQFRWSDVSSGKSMGFLIVGASALWAMGDMWSRWDKAYQNWAVHYSWYSQQYLSIGTCLYFVFILFQGLYLSAVALRDREMTYKYIQKEGAQQRTQSLFVINVFFLVYNVVWPFTLIQKENIDDILSSNVLNFGTFGLLVFHIVSAMVLWFFHLTKRSEPAATMEEEPIQIPDSPTKCFLNFFHFLYWAFFALYILQSIFLYFEVLETTTLLVLLEILAFLVVGIVFVGCKIWLLWKFIVAPNVPLLTSKYEMKHWPWALLVALTMISSLEAIIHLGNDRYNLWQPIQQEVLFQCFLSFYVVAHMALVLFEGLVAMWLLLFEDIIPYHGQDSAQKRLVAKEVHTSCWRASGVFSIYSVLFVLRLHHAEVTATIVRMLSGPSLFHLVIAITYVKLWQSCFKNAVQQRQEVQAGQSNVSVHGIRKEPWHTAKSLVDRFPYWSLAFFYFFLILLSIVRWLLLQRDMSSWIPTRLPTLSTYAIWLVYIGVCFHWLYVMKNYFSCMILIKGSFRQIWQTVQERSVLNYPKSILLGFCSFVVLVLAIISEVQRCKYSMSKWANQDWSLLLGIPLMAVHAVALICQGLLLSGACIASETTRDTKEGENVPWFHDSFGYLLVINVFLLFEHALFIFYTDTDTLAFGLIVYHAGSCCIIVVLQAQQDIAMPSDAANGARQYCTGVPNHIWLRMKRLPSPCFKLCFLIKSEPIEGTLYLICIMFVLGIARVLDRCLHTPTTYSTFLIIVFRCFTSFTLGVANYYIWTFLTSSANHDQTVRRKKQSILICSFLVVIVLLGVAEIGSTVTHQVTLSFTVESMILDFTLLITGFMNVVLVLHEGYATFLLAIQKVSIGRSHSHNASEVMDLILKLNLLYAGLGALSSIVDWTDKYSGSSVPESIVALVGHVTCSVLVPTMIIPVVERMRDNVHVDIQTEDRSETPEHGSQESSGITSAATECDEDQSRMS